MKYFNVLDKNGNLIYEADPVIDQALEPEIAYETVKLMKGVCDFGTAARIRSNPKFGKIPYPMAGKTGTTPSRLDRLRYRLVWIDLAAGFLDRSCAAASTERALRAVEATRSREHSHHPRSDCRSRATGDALLDRQRQWRDAAARPQGFLPRATALSAATCRYALEVSADVSVSRSYRPR